MDPKAREAFIDMVQQCLNNVDGQLLIEMAKSKLIYDLERGKFNTMRAEEVFQIAIERAMCNKLGEVGPITIKSIRGDDIIGNFAQHFTLDFKNNTDASDQRPVRRGIMAKIVGK